MYSYDPPWAIRAQMKAAGQELSRLMAVNPPPPAAVSSLRPYYADRFDGNIPDAFATQLDWAQKHPTIFEPLLQADVTPLDVSFYSRPATVVEYFRDWRRWDSLSDGERKDIFAADFVFLTQNLFGALLARGWNRYEVAIQNQRPDCLPLIRPSQKSVLRRQTVEMRWRLATSLHDEQEMSLQQGRQDRLWKPGWYSNCLLPWQHGEKEQTYWRVCWKFCENPATAIEYLLAGGETAVIAKRNPQTHLAALDRRIRRMTTWEAQSVIYKGTVESKHSAPNDKFFVCVANQPLQTAGSNEQGNLRITIRTRRVFPAMLSLTSLCEGEHGIPLIINPAEITCAELNFLCPTNSDTYRRIDFHWSDDHQILEAVVTGHHIPTQTLMYRFDPATKSYKATSPN